MQSSSFDLVVLGTGVAGSTVARRCRAAGWQVAVVDERPYGGTCQLRGCDPKKVLVGVTAAMDAVRRFAGKGLDPGQARVAWPALMEFKRSFTDGVSRARRASFDKQGIATLDGHARFTGPTSLVIDGREVSARHVVIATGARPMPLPLAGNEHLTTSDDVLDLPELPARIVFLGGGFVSFELGYVARIAGARVTIIERMDRPLGGFDPDLVDLLVKRTRDMDICVQLGTRVESVASGRDGLRVCAWRGDGAIVFDANLVVHGGGRVPDLAGLDLEAAGVEYDPKRGVAVNPRMQSVSNPAVYATGDAAAGGLPLTPVASFEARVAADNLLGANREIDYPAIPSVVFTTPPLAAVGLSEEEARTRGVDLEVHWQETSSWYSARHLAETASGYKVLVDRRSGRVVGAHLLGHGAEELINQFALAMRGGLTVDDLKGMIFAYPSLGSDLQSML